jgi:hypothetical protein
MTQFFLFFKCFYLFMFMKGIINKKKFFDFGSLLTEISQKSFLGTCHVPGLSFLAHMVQIY